MHYVYKVDGRDAMNNKEMNTLQRAEGRNVRKVMQRAATKKNSALWGETE